LSDATGETINLAVREGYQVEQIAQVDSTYLMGNVNWVGLRVPLHCTALGKVFLAFGAALPEGRLERRTDQTLTTRSALEADLAEVRRRGWAVADSELEPGLVALAAPVFGADGGCVAAISVSGPSVRLDPERFTDIGQSLRRKATDLSGQLGHHPSPHEKAGAA
jgi:IclR family acetate operon transcriptional repressor